MSHHPLDDPEDESLSANADPSNDRFDKIRRRLSASRSKQFGLGALLVLMLMAAIVLAWLRQSEGGIAGAAIPLTVLMGLALSVTGVIMLFEAGRLSVTGKKRLAGTFLRFGILLICGGLPGGVLLAILFAYLIRL